MTIASDKPMETPPLPGIGSVISQLRRDLFGKDVENSATYTYDWLADQVGHFTLGFTGTLLFQWFNVGIFPVYAAATGWTWAILICAIFVVVESLDFLSQWYAYQKSNRVFKFNSLEILWNCFTAVYYIAIGAVVAAFGISNPAFGFWAALAGFAFFVILAIWWLERKICFQQAGLPSYFRLPFFQNTIDPPMAKFIADLCEPSLPNDPRRTNRHLIIAGPLSSGKSTLATAIGTEFAVRQRMGIGRYSTFAKLIQTVQELSAGDKAEASDGRILWPWQTSELLIVDDVDVISEHTPGTKTDPEHELAIAKSRTELIISKISPDVRENLKYRRTVWVIGDVDDGQLERWRAMLAEVIVIGPATMTVCRFADKLSDLKPLRSRPSQAERVKL
jgi:hypothetical protein